MISDQQSLRRTVRDPVCGMDIDPAQAADSEARDGVTIYFCAKSCARQFRQDPEPFPSGDRHGPTPAAAEPEHGEAPGGPPIRDIGYQVPWDRVDLLVLGMSPEATRLGEMGTHCQSIIEKAVGNPDARHESRSDSRHH